MRIFLGIDGVDIAVALDSKEKYRQATNRSDIPDDHAVTSGGLLTLMPFPGVPTAKPVARGAYFGKVSLYLVYSVDRDGVDPGGDNT